jgi:glycosyltransferase involved in cell wall biosynthesis
MMLEISNRGEAIAGSTKLAVPDVSVVVPVYRNAETLPELHQRLCRVLEAHAVSFELLFVDDACPADSLRVIDALARDDSRVAGVALARNVGQHRAVLAGLAHTRGVWTVVMDADLQDPPEAIPELLARGRLGYAAVFAGRRGQYESRGRLLTSRLFKRLLALLCGVPADAGIYVALHRSLVERLLQMDDAKPFVVAMIGCAGLPMASLPVTRAARGNGVSAYTAWNRLRSGWRGVTYVLAWRWRVALRRPARRAGEAPVRGYLGARFRDERSADGRLV